MNIENKTREMTTKEKVKFYKKLARVVELVDIQEGKIKFPSILDTSYTKNVLEKTFDSVTYSYAQKIAIGNTLARHLIHISNFTTLFDDIIAGIIAGRKIYIRNYRLFTTEERFTANILKDEAEKRERRK